MRRLVSWFRLPAWRPTWRQAILGLGSLALVLLIYSGWCLYRDLRLLRQHAARLRNLSPSNLASLSNDLADVRSDVARLRADLWLPLAVAPYLGWVPGVGATIQAGEKFFSAGEIVLGAGAITWQVVHGPVTDALTGGTNREQAIAGIALQISANAALLQEAAADVHSAAASLQSINARRLVPQLTHPITQLQYVMPLMTAAFDMLSVGDKLAPPSETRTFLLLAQNNDELRPTGGFISGIGTISVTQGVPRMTPFQDSYQLENWNQPHPDPPEPLRKYMGLDLWVTRDGNWWPDFPTSAQAVAELYEANWGQPVHGAVAADMLAVVKLIEVLSPFELPGGQRLESGQVMDTIRQSWALPPESLVTSGIVITATRPFSGVELTLSFSRKQGQAWFDSVHLENLAQPAVNLAKNPSFEEDADRDGLPDTWQVAGLSKQDRLTTDYAHSGQRSLFIAGDPETDKMITQRLVISGDSGTRFRVSAESRADSVSTDGGPYALTVKFLYSDGKPEAKVATFPVLTHDWATAGSGEVLGEWWMRRKDIMNKLPQAIINRIKAKPMSVPWLDLLVAGRDVLEQRHAQIYFADPAVQETLGRYGWGGALGKPEGDYLCVVDSNLGYNKVTASMGQSIDYDVAIDAAGGVRAWVYLRYQNRSIRNLEVCDKFKQYVPSYDAMTQGCYWDYVRVYAPLGAELFAATGGDEPVEVISEAGHTVFSTYVVLRPGERRELHFGYALPPGTLPSATYGANSRSYALYVRKQAGTDAIPLKIQVSGPRKLVPQPDGLAPSELSFGRAVYITDLLTDRHLSVWIGP